MSLPASSVRVASSGIGDAWTRVFDAATDVVLWLDRDRRYRYVNRAIETATGHPASDFIGRTNEELGIRESAIWRERLTEAGESARTVLFESEYETPDGVRRFQSAAAPIVSADGTVESLLVISRDITDTRALRLLEGAVHHLPTAVALVEAPSGHLLLRNSRATDIFRVDPSPLSGIETYRKFVGFHPDGREYQPQEWPLSRSITSGEVIVGEVAEIRRGDGSRGVIRMTSAPLRDANGSIIAGMVTFDDITREATAEQRQRFLAAATAVLAESLETKEVLRKLARLAVPMIADYCAVHTISEGRVELVALEHRDEHRREAAREMASRYPERGEGAVRGVLTGGPSELYPEIPDALLRSAAADDTHFAYLRTVGYRSAMVLPVRGRTSVMASLTFTTADSGRSYGDDDLAFAEDLASRAGMALDNARLYEHERAARDAAERAAARLSRLHAFTAALASAVTPDDVTSALVREGRAAMGADVGFVWLLDDAGSSFLLSAHDGDDAARERGLERVPRDAVIPLADAVRSLAPVVVKSQNPRVEGSLPVAQGTVQFSALAALPLVFRAEPLGGFSFSFREPHEFTSDDLAFLTGLADQTAQALYRARLFEAEHLARAEAETLHRVGSAVASMFDLKAILQTVTDETTAITGAEFGAFFNNSVADGEEALLLDTLSGAPPDAFAKFPPLRVTALLEPTFRGEGVIRLDDVHADPRFGRSAPYYGMLPGHPPVRSYLAVPVRSRSGEVLGGLFFGHSESGRFVARHERLLHGIAAHAAVAIDNARLFAQTKAAEAAQARRAEELRLAEERLRLAVKGANVGLWNYDLVAGHLFWDATIRKQFDVDADATITVDDFYAMVHPDDAHSLRDALMTAIERHEIYDVEYRIARRGLRWIRSLASAAYGPDGLPTRVDGITIDITDQKRIEQERAALLQREQTTRAEIEATLKVRDDFLAAASHELRNPLNALQLHLVGLKRVAQRDPTALSTPAMTGRLDRAEEQITRLVRLVDTLLDISRIKSGRLDLEYTELDLVSLARDVVDQMEPMADGVAIRLGAPPHLVGRWDRLRLEQVLLNLLSNAVKYGDSKPVDITLTDDGDCVRIEVQDRGAGIPSDMMQRMFTRFERLTVDRRRGGFGLGLWISRQIVSAMGGRIDVRSELGKGSAFCVELPRIPVTVDTENTNDGKPPSQRPRRRHSDR